MRRITKSVRWIPVMYAFVASMSAAACITMILTSGGVRTETQRTGLQPITNKTFPNEIETHFAGKPKMEFAPTELGLPPDGYCKDYSNGISWRVIVCMGTQPESQP